MLIKNTKFMLKFFKKDSPLNYIYSPYYVTGIQLSNHDELIISPGQLSKKALIKDNKIKQGQRANHWKF